MKPILLFILLIFGSTNCLSQKPKVEGRCLNPKFEKTVIRYLSFTVPVYTISQLKELESDFILMDAREKEEFNTSHIPGAIHVGYNHFQTGKYLDMDKDKPVIVYCSIGYRSEKIAEKLSKAGFKNVYNLFGSIFEWANQGNMLEDAKGMNTYDLHTYNKSWSKWVDNTNIKKVY